MTASYAILVRDGILDRVKVMPFFAEFSFGSTTALQIQPAAIPYCGVYLVQETMLADGDANAGEVRFRKSARIGISVIIQNNDATMIENKLDEAYQTLMSGLLSDHTLTGFDNANKIQGFTAGMRQHQFGSIGKENEMPIAEMRLEISCDLGVETYPPLVTDDLEVIHVTTRYPPDASEDVQRVESEYDLPQ